MKKKRVSRTPSASFRVASHSPDETQDLGRALGKRLKRGDAVLMLAGLGAGKTTMIQGLVRSLGIREAVLSPTFVIAQTLRGRVPLHHLDFYRLGTKEILSMGGIDYLSGAGEIERGVVVVEWAERLKPFWPAERLEIRLVAGSHPLRRTISMTGRGRRYVGIIKDLKETFKMSRPRSLSK